jgi:phenylacetate-CoA ligase
MWTELKDIAGILRERKRLERFSREQLEADKLARFRRLVAHASLRSTYYANVIRLRGIDIARCVPTDFPMLTKSTLMANFDQLVTDRRITKQRIDNFLSRSTDPNELLFDEFHVLHTSGTSGEVGYFVYSKSDWYRGMMVTRRRERRAAPSLKRKFGRFRLGFYGATGGHFAGVSMATSAQRGVARLLMKVGVFEVNSPLPDVIAQLNAFQPDMLTGYTNALKVLAARQQTGELHIAPRMIGAGGETVTAADRATLQQAFHCDVASTYACTEHLMMGSSDPDGELMTLYDDNLIYEFFDDHSLVTNLFNKTLPLIRYRMSDILQPVPNTSGTRHLKIRNLVGRTELVPMFVNDQGVEDFVSPHTINEIFVAGVTKFQLQITSKTSFTFLVCPEPTLDAHARAQALQTLDARLREILAQKRMSAVRFTIEPRDDIGVDPRTRKFRLIVDARSARV